MKFDSSNNVVALCAKGMEAEGKGLPDEAATLFSLAWESATTDFEKFTAAHYMARNQKDPNEELKWNLASLHFAHAVADEGMKPYFASLHLNAGKSYEALNDKKSAQQHYGLAAGYIEFLPKDGYGSMIQKGIEAALKRISG